MASTAFGQSPQQKSTPQPRPDNMGASDENTPLTTFEEEMMAKRAIKLAEKEHQENVNRAREVSQLAHELHAAMKTKVAPDREDIKRLDRLEKLTKKIRGEAGGEDNSETRLPKPPADAATAVAQISDLADCLSKDVQDTPRQVVSASVIDTANVLLELVRIFRGFSH